MDIQYDVVIVGSGPAGLTAAIYASRANLKTVIFEADTPGGKLTKTYEIENYPGIVKISGVDLAMQMMEHSTSFGAEMEYEGIDSIVPHEGYFEVKTSSGNTITTKTVIVASGTRERLLDLPHASELIGRGVSYCAVCDGAFYKNKDVVVIGGGNSALEESLYLTQLVNKVNIVIRRDVFRAEPKIVEKVKNNPKINIIVKSLPDSLVIEDNKVKGMVIRNVDTGEKTEIPCEGIFPYIGADPSTGFLQDLGVLNKAGYMVVDANMETCIKGLYGAGDVVAKDLRQVVTATNDGAIAANSAARYINE